MSPFRGFPPGKVRFTPIPAQFFSELLPEIDHLGEMKVTLYALWFLDRQEGSPRYITYDDFAGDERLLAGLSMTGQNELESLEDALGRAVRRGTLLEARLEQSTRQAAVYFLNSPLGRAAFQAWREGKWSPDSQSHPEAQLVMERPNIYKLYEENIGPLTAMIADYLRDAEKTYPYEWIDEAIVKAVQNNARKWSYIQAILRKWQEEGRDGTNRQDSQKDYRRYIDGEFGDLIQH
ncbi:MAG: DnaD domain protein [Anaerolineaceae bacterium]|nr:DnaD domain protein [Anaerolineaceae bacterium]